MPGPKYNHTDIICFKKNIQKYLPGFPLKVSSTSECLQKCAKDSFYFAYTENINYRPKLNSVSKVGICFTKKQVFLTFPVKSNLVLCHMHLYL